MKDLSKGILIACLMMALSYPIVGEVTKLTINTDSSWKCINFGQEGWTSEDYDDSWWESAKTDSGGIGDGKEIWYPSDILEKTVYFRKIFEIDGDDILIGEINTGLHVCDGIMELYVNDQHVGDATLCYYNGRIPNEYDVTSYLKPGTNVIAVKASIDNYSGWALTSTIRYMKP